MISVSNVDIMFTHLKGTSKVAMLPYDTGLYYVFLVYTDDTSIRLDITNEERVERARLIGGEGRISAHYCINMRCRT